MLAETRRTISSEPTQIYFEECDDGQNVGAGNGTGGDLDLDKSFRQLLPSESHLKKSTNHRLIVDALMASMNSHDLSGLAPDTTSRANAAGGFFEDDAFKKFTEDLILKYIREEETRARHHVRYENITF